MKPKTIWIIYNRPHDFFLLQTLSTSRSFSIRAFEKRGYFWLKARKDGYECVKIKLVIVGEESNVKVSNDDR